MPQFRITQKFAMDYKINALHEPLQTVSLFDDWLIDVMRIHRKKVAIVTHTKTLVTFLIPYLQVGGAKSVPECISILLRQFLYDRDFPEYIGEMNQLFAKPSSFCKTQSRQILGHMNDFKRCIEVQAYHTSFEMIDWDHLMEAINDMPINIRPIGYTRAIELMAQLLSKTQES
jgi:hypothetical protein